MGKSLLQYRTVLLLKLKLERRRMLSELENEIGKNFNMVILLPNEDVPFSYDFFVRDELIASMGVSMGAGFVVPNSTKINVGPTSLASPDLFCKILGSLFKLSVTKLLESHCCVNVGF